MATLRICIDVPDLDRAIAFYSQAFGLLPGRRNGPHWAEMLGAGCPVDLIPVEEGTRSSPSAETIRSYGRHWTPIHLDLAVPDLEAAIRRAESAGARLERDIVVRKWGRMANMSDPFGHGFCLLQFEGRGYDAVISPAAPGA